MAIEIEGREIDTDEEGFLLDPSEWNRAVAEKIARGEQLEMTGPRGVVVNFVRRYFLRFVDLGT